MRRVPAETKIGRNSRSLCLVYGELNHRLHPTIVTVNRMKVEAQSHEVRLTHLYEHSILEPDTVLALKHVESRSPPDVAMLTASDGNYGRPVAHVNDGGWVA